MKRRSRPGDKAGKVGRHNPATPKRTNPPKAASSRRSTSPSQESEIARLTRERDEALEQLSAASDVLKVVSSSPGELEPVFQTILENATRIFEAKFGVMQLSVSTGFRAVALHDVPPAYAEAMRRDPVLHPIV